MDKGYTVNVLDKGYIKYRKQMKLVVGDKVRVKIEMEKLDG